MSTPEQDFNMIKAQIDTLTAAASATGVNLGTSQRTAIEAYVQGVTGIANSGPVVSIQGLPVTASGAADEVTLIP